MPVEKDKVYLSFQTNPELYNLENTSQLWPYWPGIDFDYEILILEVCHLTEKLWHVKLIPRTIGKRL